MPRVGQGLEQVGIATSATAILGWAGSLATCAARSVAASAQHLDVMLPVVAQVVGVHEPGRQPGQAHTALVDLVDLFPVVERDCVDGAIGAELVQVGIGPADRHLQHFVELVEGDRCRHVEHPLDVRHDIAHRDPQPDRPHRGDSSAPGTPQHLLYLRPDPHQHGSFRPGGQAIVRDGSRATSAAYRARSCEGSSSSRGVVGHPGVELGGPHWHDTQASNPGLTVSPQPTLHPPAVHRVGDRFADLVMAQRAVGQVRPPFRPGGVLVRRQPRQRDRNLPGRLTRDPDLPLDRRAGLRAARPLPTTGTGTSRHGALQRVRLASQRGQRCRTQLAQLPHQPLRVTSANGELERARQPRQRQLMLTDRAVLQPSVVVDPHVVRGIRCHGLPDRCGFGKPAMPGQDLRPAAPRIGLTTVPMLDEHVRVSQRLLNPAQPVIGLGQFAVQLERVEVRRRLGVLVTYGDRAFQDLGVRQSRPTPGPANLPVETIKFAASHRDIITHPAPRQDRGCLAHAPTRRRLAPSEGTTGLRPKQTILGTPIPSTFPPSTPHPCLVSRLLEVTRAALDAAVAIAGGWPAGGSRPSPPTPPAPPTTPTAGRPARGFRPAGRRRPHGQHPCRVPAPGVDLTGPGPGAAGRAARPARRPDDRDATSLLAPQAIPPEGTQPAAK